MRRCIVIGGGILTLPICQELEFLGVRPLVFDANPDCAAARAGYDFRCISTKSVSACVNLARFERSDVFGVTTCGADVEVTVAAIANELNLPGIPLEVAQRCHDKALMRKALAVEGLAVIGVTGTVADLKSDLRPQHWDSMDNPLKVIVKPVDNCGSRGVIGATPGTILDAIDYAGQFGDRLIIEPLLEGSFHTVEGFTVPYTFTAKTFNGLVEPVDHIISIIDTRYLLDSPCETGLNTTQLPAEQQQELAQFALRVKKEIGITAGPWKVDICLTEDGPKLIELTARLSGGFHCQFASRAAYGTNEIRATAAWATGWSVREEWLTHQRNRGAAVRAAFPAPGRVTRIDTERARRCHGVERVEVFCKVGDLVGPYRNSADRVAFAMTSADTTEQAIQWAEYAAGSIVIETEPICPECEQRMEVSRESVDEPESRRCSCGLTWQGFPPRSLMLEERF